MKSRDEIAQSADKAAIGLSFLCVLHCLLLPVAVLLIPSADIFGLDDEFFHKILLVGVLPISTFALLSGQRKHGDLVVLIVGICGLSVLIVTAAIGHEFIGEVGERLATLLGSTLVAFSHFRNFKLCRLRSSHHRLD
ncbi:MAG: MerC domain-containing protein [Pseudohongiellaceae bacterium]